MSDQIRALSMPAKAMAKQMVRSWQAPQFSLETDIDCDAIINYKARLTFPASYTTILTKVVADTLVNYPALRSSWADNHIIEHDHVNIGIAVDTPRGLIVPVVFDAAQKSLAELHEDMERIKKGAVKGIYPLEMLQNAVFTISNLGIYNVSGFKAIVNAPQSAILAVGKMTETPIVKKSAIVIGRMMKLCISVDHRVADGATAAKFITELAQRLTNLGQ